VGVAQLGGDIEPARARVCVRVRLSVCVCVCVFHVAMNALEIVLTQIKLVAGI